MVFDSNATGNYEIFDMNASGVIEQQLTNNAAYDSWWARISPNRQKILFYRDPAGIHDTDPRQNSLWEMNADGSDQTELLAPGAYGWGLQGHAEWSPDGTKIVMVGGPWGNSQIFVTDATGANPVQVTNRGGTNIDPSWAPNGSGILFVGCPQAQCVPAQQEIYTLSPVSVQGTLTRFTNDTYADYDPYYSPDGSQIAWLRNVSGNDWSIEISNIGGGGYHALIDDGNINSKPDWSSDGALIYFHRLIFGTDKAFGIWSINPDGTGLHEVLAPKGTVGYEYPGT